MDGGRPQVGQKVSVSANLVLQVGHIMVVGAVGIICPVKLSKKEASFTNPSINKIGNEKNNPKKPTTVIIKTINPHPDIASPFVRRNVIIKKKPVMIIPKLTTAIIVKIFRILESVTIFLHSCVFLFPL